MGWAETRKRARRTVHATFALSAVYTDPDGTVTPCMARMHNEMKEFGDLDREGFARVVEDVNQVIFDADEIEPKKKGEVYFKDEEVTFIITGFKPRSTDNFIRAEVTLK